MKAKWCWVATETRKGWRLKLSVGSRDFRCVGLLLQNESDIGRVTGDAPCVIVHLADSATQR